MKNITLEEMNTLLQQTLKKKAIIDSAIEKFINQMYDNYMSDRYYESIRYDAKQIVKDNQSEIVNTVINKVSEEILRKKAITDQMPKKSEINNINKEWESYFMELIDRAIAKRFK